MVMNFDLTLYLAASKREGLVDIGTKHTLVGGGVRILTKKMSISLSRIVICQPSKGGDIITNL